MSGKGQSNIADTTIRFLLTGQSAQGMKGESGDLPILRRKDKGGREPGIRIEDREGKMVRGMLQGVLHDGSAERHKMYEVKDKQSGEEGEGCCL